jgi:hypothetical protein
MDAGIPIVRVAHKDKTYTQSVSERLERACLYIYIQIAGRSKSSNDSSRKSIINTRKNMEI